MPSTQTDRLGGLTTSVAVKPPCKAVSTTALTLSGEQTIGGTTCVDGDRVLYALTGGSVDNGIWVVRTTAWERAKDFDGARDAATGTLVLVDPGTAAVFWQVTTIGDIRPGTTSVAFAPIDPSTLSVDASDVAYASETVYPDLTIGQRIHRDYINVGDIGGTDPTGTVDNSAKIAAAIATGKMVRIDGTYRIDATLTNPLMGLVGDGARKSRLIVNAQHAVTFASNAGLDRRPARFEDFAVDSYSNSCDAKFVIYAAGVAGGAAAVYNSGIHLGGLIVGRSGRFGGLAYIKDVADFTAVDCRGTDLSRGVQMVGSVLYCSIGNLRSNNDSAASTLTKYGVSTESATYDTGTMVPESVKVDGLVWIRCTRAVNHTAGLFVRFTGVDTEASEIGVNLNAAATLRDAILAPDPAANDWKGVSLGVSAATPDDGFWLRDIDVNMLRVPGAPASSYGIYIGDGVSPVYMADINGVRIRGLANSLVEGIHGRDLRSLTLRKASIRTTVTTGDDLNVTGRRLTIENCDVTDGSGVVGGTFTVSDGGEATATGRIVNNQVGTLSLTMTTRSSWEIAGNDAVKRKTFGSTSVADGGTIAHGLSAAPTSVRVTATTAGEFASVTALGGTTFTVAIKTHTGAAGTTAAVHWEAEY